MCMWLFDQSFVQLFMQPIFEKYNRACTAGWACSSMMNIRSTSACVSVHLWIHAVENSHHWQACKIHPLKKKKKKKLFIFLKKCTCLLLCCCDGATTPSPTFIRAWIWIRLIWPHEKLAGWCFAVLWVLAEAGEEVSAVGEPTCREHREPNAPSFSQTKPP